MLIVVTAFMMLPHGGPLQVRTVQDSIDSPALRALAEAAARDSAAERRFWASVDSTGAPLIEALPGDSTARLVTFVWQGDDALRGAAVITPHSLIDIERGRMRRLAGTRVWHRSYRMRNDAVMIYRFGPDDSMLPFVQEPDLGARMARWRPDPLNPVVFALPDGAHASVLRLTAPSDRISDSPPGQRGAVRTDTVPGSGAWRDLEVFVYTPPGLSADPRDRPVVILLDGDRYLRSMAVDSLLDRMNGVDAARAPIVVMVPADGARTRQYDCNPDWSDYLAGTLVPWIDARYGARRGALDRIVGGYSLGGLAAACAAVRHPAVFGNVLAQSGSFYRALGTDEPEALARSLAAGPPLPIRWSLSIGLLETAAIPSADPSMLTATRHLRDVLTARGYAIHYHEFYGGHEHVAWVDHLPDALAFLLRR